MRLADLKKIPLVLGERTTRNLLFALFIAAASFFFGKAIVDLNIRLAVITALIFTLGVFCLRIQTGVLALLIYLPFMAFLRRYIYIYNPYVRFDPILIISSILTIFMFLYLIFFYSDTIIGPRRKKPIVRYTTLLLIIYAIEMFNPLQEGLSVGISGAIFFLIPTIWFYFGRFIDRERMNYILYITVFIGVVVAMYGLKQNFLGYTSFEKYWAELGGYTALSIRGWLRPVSTFASSQEYTTYIMIAGIISFALVVKDVKNLPLLAVLALIVLALIMSASRGALLGLIMGIGLYTILGLKETKRIGIAVLIMFIVYAGLVARINFSSVNPDSAEAAYLAHTASGIFDPFAKGSTLWSHWSGALRGFSLMFRNPIGYGLGAGTLAATKFGGIGTASEGFIASLQGSTGLVGTVVFFVLFFFLARNSLLKYRRDGDFFSKLVFVITIEVFLTIDLRLYSIGPLIWLLWGYQSYRSS
ncbi:hypothetical protein CH333_06885 [candidate division WOR-3 bacterium JGI_Cruoil_03_44_89]|uniref:O-antigen ligase domain-containing protein n=1 Tax=candidate division WOR-3 bacterium JGI_Cruoil_03_44_89 TaxID=1973748 RepID=A0A235BRM8_UNCW3|nr:MAG: hypothetical protein CH333_06885 [candidate division WOR-3 bacterium JGI_Cruoil_03_44_89]